MDLHSWERKPYPDRMLSTHYLRIQLDICLFYSMIRSWTLFQISIWVALQNPFSRLYWPKFHLLFSQISQKPWGGFGRDLPHPRLCNIWTAPNDYDYYENYYPPHNIILNNAMIRQNLKLSLCRIVGDLI